jgi:hypothetical protein
VVEWGHELRVHGSLMTSGRHGWKTVALIAAAALLTVCLGLWLLCVAVQRARRTAIEKSHTLTAPETGYRFPALSDIARMTVKSFYWSDGTHLLQFDVPTACWAEIFDALSPSELDPRPCPWEYSGTIVIQMKRGEERRIALYCVGPEPSYPDIFPLGAFSAGATWESCEYFRGGNEIKLKAAITRAYTKREKHIAAKPD